MTDDQVLDAMCEQVHDFLRAEGSRHWLHRGPNIKARWRAAMRQALACGRRLEAGTALSSSAAREAALVAALTDAADRLRTCIVYSGTDAKYADIAVSKFRALARLSGQAEGEG